LRGWLRGSGRWRAGTGPPHRVALPRAARPTLAPRLRGRRPPRDRARGPPPAPVAGSAPPFPEPVDGPGTVPGVRAASPRDASTAGRGPAHGWLGTVYGRAPGPRLRFRWPAHPSQRLPNKVSPPTT